MAWIYDPVWSGSVGLGMVWQGFIGKIKRGVVCYGWSWLVPVGQGEVGFGLSNKTLVR